MRVSRSVVIPAVFFLLGACVFAGSLEPTSPPAPTMKTLDQVQPRIPITSLPKTISQPGSYYFVTDLVNATPAANSFSIYVNADDVTIDLMGYSLKGPGKDSGINCGGIALLNQKNIEIRNGTICDFSNFGILGGVTTEQPVVNSRFLDLRIHNNKYHGLMLQGSDHTLQNCTVTDNTGGGISLQGTGNTVRNCVAANNTNGAGIACTDSSLITDCVAEKNYVGIAGNNRCSILNNISSENTSCGIAATDGCLIQNNLVFKNQLYGIEANNNGTLIGNQIKENGLNNDYGTGAIIKATCRVKNNAFLHNKYNLWVGVGYGNTTDIGNCIEDNFFVGSIYSIFFSTNDNVFINNRFTQHTSQAWSGQSGNIDGGGNITY